jgi:hypothetical protein
MAVWWPVDFDDILTQQDNSQKNDPNEVLVISSDSEREENNVHRKGKNLKPGSVEMILKCHETLVSENHRSPILRTAELLQISRETVKKVVKRGFVEKIPYSKGKFTKITEHLKCVIVSKIYGSYSRSFVPTVLSIIKELAEDGIQLPYKTTHIR